MTHSLVELYHRLKGSGFFGKAKKRSCLDIVLERVEASLLRGDSSLLFVQLPIGYGKTAVPYSLSLWALTIDDIHLERSIHVLPLRSIIEDAMSRFKGEKGGGLKALEIGDVEKIAGAQYMFTYGSSFLQKGYVATTIDTFTLSFCKLPTVEARKIARGRSYGHYEVIRASITSSAVVFDEAHLLIEEEGGSKRGLDRRGLTALLTLLMTLIKLKVPSIVMTATLPCKWRDEIISWLRERLPNFKYDVMEYGSQLPEGSKLVDNEFEDELSAVNIRTSIVESEENYLERICAATGCYDKVLVVANTIGRACSLFELLKGKVDIEPMLLHAKFTEGDRRHIYSLLQERKKWICIATQVVEAGVDISAQATFTDIAPLCALIQRSGRCCRPSHAIGGEGEFVICSSEEATSTAQLIYKQSYISAAREHVSKVVTNEVFNWHRSLDYIPLLDEVYGKNGLNLTRAIDHQLSQNMEGLILRPYWTSHDAIDLLMQLGSFTRDEPLTPGIVCELNEIEKSVHEVDCWVPLEWNEVRRILKEGGKVVEIDHDGGVTVKYYKSAKPETFYKRLIEGYIIGVQVPPALYDKKVGLFI